MTYCGWWRQIGDPADRVTAGLWDLQKHNGECCNERLSQACRIDPNTTASSSLCVSSKAYSEGHLEST